MENNVFVEESSKAGANVALTNVKEPKFKGSSKKVNSILVTGWLHINDKGNLETTLNNPFNDEPLSALVLTFANPNKQDRWGNKDDDRRGARNEGALKYCTRKAGRDVSFDGVCTCHSMTDKKKNISSNYIAIHIHSPFDEADINGGNPIRAYFKQGSVQGEFDFVAMQRLNVTPTLDKR